MPRLLRTLILALVPALASPVFADGGLLYVSYDVARDFYKDFNPLFQKHWQATTGETVDLRQSHAGSSKQVRAVADGLEADVVTMNQASDVDFLAEKGLVAADYAKKFPNSASPYTSTMVFIVRKGNPKALPVDKARRLEALIFSLDGQAGRVRLWDFGARLVSSPQPVRGAPVVTEALAMRKTLTSRGWTRSTKVLLAGDWIQIRDELKRVLADVTSDLSGGALIRVAPMLRGDYPSGTPLPVSRPSGVFMLRDDKAVTFQRSPGVFTDVSLSFVEAFYP